MRRCAPIPQKPVSDQHEPRNPHPDEWHHRDEQSAADTEPPIEQADYARTINDSAESLLTILNDFLALSKVGAG